MKKMREVAATVDDALDADGLGQHTEEDDLSPDNSQARLLADFRTKLVGQRVFGNAVELLPYFMNERDGAAGIVFGDELCNGLEIAFDVAREL